MKRAAIRLPRQILARLDRLAAQLSAARPGRRLSRAALIRISLAHGLGMVETRGVVSGGSVLGSEPPEPQREPG